MLIRLTKGQIKVLPPDSDVDIIAKEDGTLRILHADGTEVPIGSGSGDVGTHVELYIRPDGDDSNDGLTRATALKTGMAAAAITNALGGGTWHVAAGAWPSVVPGAGWWLRGIYDVGIGGPGWIDITSSVNIFFESTVGAQFGFQTTPIVPGGGAPTFSDSPFQLCGTTQMVWVYGLQANPGALAVPALRVGLSSPPALWAIGTTYARGACVRYAGISYSSLVNGNVGHQPDVSPTQWYRLRVGIDDGLGVSLTANTQWSKYQLYRSGNKVCPTVESAYQFLGTWEDGQIVNSGVVDPDDSRNACFRMFYESKDLDSNVCTYYNNFRNTTLQGGGFWSIGGNSQLVFEGRTLGENMVMADLVCETGYDDAGTQADIYGTMTVADALADAISTRRNKGGRVTSYGTVGKCDGPLWFANLPFPSRVVDNIGIKGQFGTTGPFSALQTDKQLAGYPVSPRYNNVAPDISTGGGTPVADAWGTAGRGRHAPFAYLFNSSTLAYAVGDRIAFGAMVKFTDNDPTDGNCVVQSGGGPVTFAMGGSGTYAGQSIVLNAGQSRTWLPEFAFSRYQWRWVWGMIRIDAIAGAGDISAVIGPTGADVSDSWCIRVPGSDPLSDSAVAAMAMNAGPWPNATAGGVLKFPTIGNSALRPGQADARWDAHRGLWLDISYGGGVLRGAKAEPASLPHFSGPPPNVIEPFKVG